MVDAAQGGTQLTAVKIAARKALVTALRQIAAYVQSLAGQDLAMLLSSGFQVNSTNRAQSELDVPTVTIDNGNTTQLIANLTPVANAHSYQVHAMTPDGKVAATTVSPQARNIVIPGLMPGVTYTIQARGVGGSTGYSDWSDPTSHMAM